MTVNGNGRNGLHVEVKKPEATTIVMSKMGGKIFDQAALLAYQMLQACECHGHYLLRVRDHSKMKGQAKIRIKYAIGQAIHMTLKPGDNGTAWEYDLVPPLATDPEELCKRLQRYLSSPAESPQTESEIEVEKPPEKPVKNIIGTDVLGNEIKATFPDTAPDPVPEPPAAPAPPKPPKTLLRRVSELEQMRLRIEERKDRILKLDAQKAILMAQIKVIDDEAMKVVEEDERDHEAQEAKEILDNLEKLFMKG